VGGQLLTLTILGVVGGIVLALGFLVAWFVLYMLIRQARGDFDLEDGDDA
jgi:uncharacterized membrane protein